MGRDETARRGLTSPTTRSVRRALPVMLAALSLSLVAPGCTEFDTTPPDVIHGTLGEEIVQVFCERIAADAERSRPAGTPRDVTGALWKPVCEGRTPPPADAPARLRVLMDNRSRLARALDQMLPETLEDDLGVFVTELLPFFDPPDERLPQNTDQLAELLLRLQDDSDALEALAQLSQRRGYRPPRLGLGLARPALAYPDLDLFAARSMGALIDGEAAEPFRDLQRAGALEMASAEVEEPSTDSTPSTLAVTRDLLFRSDPIFGASSAAWALLRDRRGMARVTPDAAGGVPSPFLDLDGDDLPDLDPNGAFSVVSGAATPPPPFPIIGETGIARDPSGRATRPDGSLFYEHIDLAPTMLSALVGEAGGLFDPEEPGVLLMAPAFPLLLGTPGGTSQGYGAYTLQYTAFDSQVGALYDLVHAVGEIMHRPATTDALRTAEALLREHESEVAGVVRAARFTANAGDRHPEAQLEQPNILWDDLIALAIRINRQPGMLEALMRGLGDRRGAELGAVFATFMRNRDRVTYDPGNPGGAPVGLPLDQPVDATSPDTFDNESLFQRTLGLIDALSGVEVCNKEGAVLDLDVTLGPITVPLRWPLFGTAGRCEIFRIANVAEAYARTIIGDYELEIADGFLDVLVSVASSLGIDVDAALEASSGIPGLTRRPTPQALNRLVFWGLADASGVASCSPDGGGGDCNSPFAGQAFDPVIDRHGNLVIERFHGTIFAWEEPGFYEGMRPLLEVLHQDGFTYDPSGNYFFGDLLTALHLHWGSRANTQTCGPDDGCRLGDPNFSYQSNARSYEALVAESFDEGAMMRRAQELLARAPEVEASPGRDGVRALADATSSLIDVNASGTVTDRRGRSTTSVNDGSREVPLTPLYLVLESLDAIDRALETAPTRRDEWRQGRAALVERLLSTDERGAGFALRNQPVRGILAMLLTFTVERIEAHRDAGDLLEWATGLDERLGDTLREPLFAALVRLLAALGGDLEARDAIAALVHYLLAPESPHDAQLSATHAAADALMLLEDDRLSVPVIRALAAALAPNAADTVSTGVDPDVERAWSRDSLDLIRDIQAVDDARTLRTVLSNAVQIPSAGDEVTPLETIVDVIAEVNRATPGAGGPMDAVDHEEVLRQTRLFMVDERHGLRRLESVLRQRKCFPEMGTPCTAIGTNMESRGLCYPQAICTCIDEGSGPAWRCLRP